MDELYVKRKNYEMCECYKYFDLGVLHFGFICMMWNERAMIPKVRMLLCLMK